YSVIVFAPIAALLAVLLTNPHLVMPVFAAVFMDRMVEFIKLFFPVFLLGAIFGKVIAISGFANVISQFVIKLFGVNNAMAAIVVVGAILTYGGISLFVVAFTLYPFSTELFRAASIPKRLIPATIALGAFTFTMDAFPGSPQIQNIIPTAFFHTDAWAAPWLGFLGGIFVFILGLCYLQWQKRKASKAGEGYGLHHINEPEVKGNEKMPSIFIAILPLILVAVCNKEFAFLISKYYGKVFNFSPGLFERLPAMEIAKYTGVWAVEMALVIGILTVIIFSFARIRRSFKTELNASVGGALLATLNTASEYGFGAVIAILPGFQAVRTAIASAFRDPLVNEAVTVTILSGITGSASGGLSIALGSMSDTYIKQAADHGIANEVLHRVASMASGGMDTLPHNGAIITLFIITGLTHKQSYKDIFALTILKVAGAFFVIALYYLFGIV
ncbi:MAG: GntP family permease, partial [Flavitalea sp.]